jgi:hypothetical protein
MFQNQLRGCCTKNTILNFLGAWRRCSRLFSAPQCLGGSLSRRYISSHPSQSLATLPVPGGWPSYAIRHQMVSWTLSNRFPTCCFGDSRLQAQLGHSHQRTLISLRVFICAPTHTIRLRPVSRPPLLHPPTYTHLSHHPHQQTCVHPACTHPAYRVLLSAKPLLPTSKFLPHILNTTSEAHNARPLFSPSPTFRRKATPTIAPDLYPFLPRAPTNSGPVYDFIQYSSPNITSPSMLTKSSTPAKRKIDEVPQEERKTTKGIIEGSPTRLTIAIGNVLEHSKGSGKFKPEKRSMQFRTQQARPHDEFAMPSMSTISLYHSAISGLHPGA